MDNQKNNPVNEKFFMDVLARIIENANGNIMPRGRRFDELERYLFTYSLLSDEYSRNVYARLLARMLAFEFFAKERSQELFPIWSKEFRENYERNKATVILPDLKHPNDLASRVIFPETFYMPAYEYKAKCTIKENDIVFDIGAWIGDTSYVFSEKLNGNGHIFAFEPMPQNYETLCENAKKIPNLSVHNIALGKEKGTLKFKFGGSNSGGSRQAADGTYDVAVSTVDDFVKENNIEKVDFIKADIEGAECDMLLGAAETIRRYHPKLAICIYHRGQTDHYKVPEVILSIREDYEFYIEAYQDELLAHFQDGLQETVLFAVPVDYIPERPLPIGQEKVNSIKALYVTVHNKLFSNYMSQTLQSFIACLDKYLGYKLEWKVVNNAIIMQLKNNGFIQYKLYLSRNSIETQLLIRNFQDLHELQRNNIQVALDNFLETHSDYVLISKEWGIYITKVLPLPQMATPDNLACNMAVLIKDTIMKLWENGLVDPECVKSLLLR